jgi:hypothetical protein
MVDCLASQCGGRGRKEMVPNDREIHGDRVTEDSGLRYSIVAPRLLSIGLVQASRGKSSKDSSKEAAAGLKPLLCFSVYTFATAESANQNK